MGSDAIVARLGYLGIVLVLVLGGLGLPVLDTALVLEEIAKGWLEAHDLLYQ